MKQQPSFMPAVTKRKHKPLTYEQYENRVIALEDTMTVREVMNLYGFDKKTVIGAIDRGALIARKADVAQGQRGGTWLIEKLSVIELWGEPKGRSING